MKIKFEKIVFGDRFCTDFVNLNINNILEFNDNRVCIVYGPNGTGKTSLSNVLRMDNKEIDCIMAVDGVPYTKDSTPAFHVIEDQNGRNIIAGSTEDFILGDNIKREYELKKRLDTGFDKLLKTTIVNELKNNFGISKKNTPFDDLISNPKIFEFVSDIANNRSKGKNINWSDFVNIISSLSLVNIDEAQYPYFSYFITDYKNDDSIIRKFLNISLSTITKEPYYQKIEQTSEAIRILEKYKSLPECIVCDNDIEYETLINKKKTQNESAIASLSKESKDIIKNIITEITREDPFLIKQSLESAMLEGTNEKIIEKHAEINEYKKLFEKKIYNMLIISLAESELKSMLEEYSTITQESPEFENEDIIFIETFLNDCLERKIKLERDGEKNLRLLLGKEEFLNQPRNSLSLSNGEQNFLSLAFELMKARKIEKKLIVLDDPISSFDSIYKNKIAYAILKILNNKKSIILTHNTDLIKLLEHQAQKSFKLYQLHNRSNGENGFVYIDRKEVKLLLYIHEVLQLLREDIKSEIVNEKGFLVSIIPFMRGYCQIVGDVDSKNKLTKLMHGYETEVINISEIFQKIFSDKIITGVHCISVSDILAMDVHDVQIIKNLTYPLFSRTLQHTFTYLYLRLAVEKKLTEKYSINTRNNDMLSKIILSSFKTNSKKDINNRVFFLSRKTLLNEFNHFEMDMNIFQPAVDIQNQVLAKETEDILNKLESL
ncbi:AAA family ATPase [Spirochaeta dissipatitropha]